MPGNGRNLSGRGGPVLAIDAVTAADRLMQRAVAIDQRHGHAVDLGLYPDVIALA